VLSSSSTLQGKDDGEGEGEIEGAIDQQGLLYETASSQKQKNKKAKKQKNKKTK
jgi:hypothetical protein